MQHLRRAAVSGFNGLLAKQKKFVVPTRVSLSFFSDDISVIHDGVPVADIDALDIEAYRPHGDTALLDGIGSMIELVAERVDLKPYPSRVLIAILTDGLENSSVRFSKKEIFKLISFRRLVCNWQFVFMGAKGSQTIQSGLSLGIQRSNIVEFGTSPEGIQSLMSTLSGALKAYQLGNRNFALLLKDAEGVS